MVCCKAFRQTQRFRAPLRPCWKSGIRLGHHGGFWNYELDSFDPTNEAMLVSAGSVFAAGNGAGMKGSGDHDQLRDGSCQTA